MGANSGREIEIEVFTESDLIRGRLSTSQARLSDTLNYELPHVLVLANASSRPLDGPDEPPTRSAFAHLNTLAIVFTVPITPEPSLEKRRQSGGFDYVEKEPHQAVISAPPFKFEGGLHLPKGDEVERSLWALTPSFVPLTDVTVRLVGSSAVSWHREVIILNRRRAQILLPI
jgi:hypothetical protein